MRYVIAVWCGALAALCGLVAPGDWRWVALVPLFGFAGLLAVVKPYRPVHADRARLRLVPDGGTGSMILREEQAMQAKAGWGAEYELAHDWRSHGLSNNPDPWRPVAGPRPALSASGAGRDPGPAAQSSLAAGPDWQPTRKAGEDETFRLWLAADCLAYERAITEDAHLFTAAGWAATDLYLNVLKRVLA
jgi:hypothetical protein